MLKQTYTRIRLRSRQNTNYLKVKFNGSKQNLLGIGNLVTIYTDGNLQVSELMLTRGYQSSVGPSINFGIQNQETIDSLIVQWPDGSLQKLTNIKSKSDFDFKTMKMLRAIKIVCIQKTIKPFLRILQLVQR